ncbi:MAG: DEAD/DEAH box helicase [Rhodobacteraceae bacterium]|nr:DEAD/DEAH box helicase [Paracoccaceae bacterium]
MKQALADALAQRGYDKLTPVQEAVSNPELDGSDLLVSAQTGSGKTVGFGLALAPTLLGEADSFSSAHSPLALIIAPTRELAMQVKRELMWLYAKTGAVVASCVGGMDMRDERRALSRGAHIVVATPGRLRDHIMRKSIDLSEVKGVVLDEADEMLDLGFREDLEFILAQSPDTRRTLMFSATVPRGIANLAKSYQKNAVRVTTVAESSQHSDIDYQLMNVGPRDAENAIINVLRYYEAPNALVFANTRAMVNRLTTRLSNRGFSVVPLSGELSQNERTHALQAMRDGRARVCVATDVAARGLDLPNLDLVVHAELPSNHEALLHRSGRTGRAGRKGVSVLIVPPAARRKAQRILQSAKVVATMSDAPSAEAVMERDEARMIEDPSWAEAMTDRENGTVSKLLDTFNPEQIATAFLRLYRSSHTAPEELSAVGKDTSPVPRAAFGPSVWFSITGGRAKGAEPRRYLPMLCKAGDVTRDDIGAIRIRDTESFVEIRKAAVAGFMKALGGKLELEPGAVIKQLDKPPALANSPRPKYVEKGQSAKPEHSKPKHSAAPIEWNDAPEPRRKKPKPTGKPGGVKPAYPKSSRKPEHSRPEGVVETYKKKPNAGAPGSKPSGKPGRSKNTTPVGKANSKKNKARRAATTGGKGGSSAPKRSKT